MPSQLNLTILAVFNAFFIPLIFFFYPETQNLSLEQIDKLFTGDKVLLHWKSSMGDDEAPSEDPRAAFGEKNEIKHIDNEESKEFL